MFKKLFIVPICLFSVLTVFAEEYSTEKMKELHKTNASYSKKIEYAGKASISKDSDFSHIRNYFYYNYSSTTYKDANEIINKVKEMYKLNENKKGLNVTTACCLAMYGYFKQAFEYAEKFKSKSYYNNLSMQITSASIRFPQKQILSLIPKKEVYNILAYQISKQKKKYDIMWDRSKDILINTDGGFDNSELCYQIVIDMFRYCSKIITKEEQIKFLQDFVNIYPIPGTDFNKWKNVMGFVGFKYKALTGKNLL